jgi:NAD(P) transhydrogenase subunit beta
MANEQIGIQLAYVIAAALFIFGLKFLGSPATARRGNQISAVGMLLAVVAALMDQGIVDYSYILAGFIIGGAIGAAASRLVQMTAMPEMVALFNGFGGLASLCVGIAAVGASAGTFTLFTVVLSILIGGVTFTGSIIAWGKLSEKLGNLKALPNQKLVSFAVVGGLVVFSLLFIAFPGGDLWLLLLVALALA